MRHPATATAAALSLALTASAAAAPQGAEVVAGSATFSQAGKTTTVTTATPRTIIEYQGFDITNTGAVVFDQPTSNSAVLNRIVSGTPTFIQGQLTSNGQVYVVNPAGVFFANSAVVDVGRLVAAAANLSDSDFLAGLDRFTDAQGQVSNGSPDLFGRQGVVLVGRNVNNQPGAAVRSEDGQIVLAVGDDVLITDGPDGRLMVKLTGFGGPPGSADSRLNNRGTVDAGPGGAVVLGAGDLLGLSVLSSGRVEAADITLETGDAPLNLSRNSSRFPTLSDTATITVNTAELHYFADVAPNDRLVLNAPGGFSDRSNSGLGPSIVNGNPFPPTPGTGTPGTGDPGLGDPASGGATFVDAYARFLPVEPLAVAPAAVVQIDPGQSAAMRRDLGVDVKRFEEQPLLESLLAAAVLNDLTPGSFTSGGGDTSRVSAGRLGYTAAQDAIDAYGRVFYVNAPRDDVAASDPTPDELTAADQTHRVRMTLQAAADRYMADAETTEIEPSAFLAWLEEQDREALEALAGLDELVNDAMPSLGLSATELDRFRRWTYGKIAPQGVSLRTLDELVAAAGRS
ncbi:MAG: filamentous hemagglutinin N-terminal domain-containing protein [Planctomycetota bacterium]